MVMSSCVPVGYTLIRFVAPQQLEEVPLSEAGRNELKIRIPKTFEKKARLALRVTSSQISNAASDDLRVRYQYRIDAARGMPLQQGAGVIDYASSTSRSGAKGPEHLWSTYEKVFDPFPVEPGETIQVAVTLEPDHPLAQAQVRLYGPSPAAEISLFTALVLWVLGLILALTGGLLLLQTLSVTLDAGRASSAQMSLGFAQDEHRASLAAPAKEERIWAMVCHLSIFSGYLLVPFGHLIGPLVIWLVKREQSHFLDWHGREALNFNLSITFYTLAGLMICLTIIGLLVGLIVLFLVVLLHVAATLYVAIRAQQGDWVRYPLTLRLVSPPVQARGM